MNHWINSYDHFTNLQLLIECPWILYINHKPKSLCIMQWKTFLRIIRHTPIMQKYWCMVELNHDYVQLFGLPSRSFYWSCSHLSEPLMGDIIYYTNTRFLKAAAPTLHSLSSIVNPKAFPGSLMKFWGEILLPVFDFLFVSGAWHWDALRCAPCDHARHP